MMAIIAFYEFSSVIISSEITRMHHLITMNVFRTHPSGTLRYFIDLELDLLMVSQKKNPGITREFILSGREMI